MTILWSGVWLVLLGTIALFFFTQLLSQIWWMLLLVGIVLIAIYVLVALRRRGHDRW
jgi:type II secretory pathway component PulF